MAAGSRALAAFALAVAATVTGPAQAQFAVGSLSALLEADATAEMRNFNAAKAKPLAFEARDFRFRGTPPLKYELVTDFAWYIARCESGPLPNLTVFDFLFPSVLPATYGLTMEAPPSLPGLSFVPREGKAPDPLTGIWGTAITQGRAGLDSHPPQLPAILPPTPNDGVLLLAVTPAYHFKEAAYDVSVALSAVVVTDQQGVERVETPKSEVFHSVTGLMSGGKWAQGSGVLVVPAPRAMSGRCEMGVIRNRLTAADLGAHGITPGKPFEVSVPGTLFVRTTHAPR